MEISELTIWNKFCITRVVTTSANKWKKLLETCLGEDSRYRMLTHIWLEVLALCIIVLLPLDAQAATRRVPPRVRRRAHDAQNVSKLRNFEI